MFLTCCLSFTFNLIAFSIFTKIKKSLKLHHDEYALHVNVRVQIKIVEKMPGEYEDYFIKGWLILDLKILLEIITFDLFVFFNL